MPNDVVRAVYPSRHLPCLLDAAACPFCRIRFLVCVPVSMPCLRRKEKINKFQTFWTLSARLRVLPSSSSLHLEGTISVSASPYLFSWMSNAIEHTGIQVAECTRHKVIELLGSAPNNKKRINATNQRIQKTCLVLSIFPSLFLLPSFLLILFSGRAPIQFGVFVSSLNALFCYLHF